MSERALQIRELDLASYALIERDIERYWVPGRVPMLHRLFVHQFANLSPVAVDGDEIAGFIFGLLATTASDGYIHLIAVRDDYRRRGVAHDLHHAFVGRARAHGAEWIKAVVRPDNAASIAFHERVGMACELIPGYAGPGEDRLVFKKPVLAG